MLILSEPSDGSVNKQSKARALQRPTFPLWLVAPTCNGDKKIMTYAEHFGYWIVVRHFPNANRLVLGRYRKRADAEGHLNLLQMFSPRGSFAIAYDAPAPNRSPSP